MANLNRVPLTTGQGVSAIIAGIIGHILFSLASFSLIIGLIGMLAKAALFSWIDGLLEQATLEGQGGSTLLNTVESLQSVLNTLGIVLVIGSVVSIVLAFLISGAIMKAGKVRKPWGATFSAMIIVGLLNLGLFWLYLLIGLGASGETGFIPTYPIAWTVGTVVIGALVWLWMAHIRRPTLAEVEGSTGVPADAIVPPSDAPVLDPGAEPAAAAPVVDPSAAPAAVDASAAKPATSKPSSKPASSKTAKPTTDAPPSTTGAD